MAKNKTKKKVLKIEERFKKKKKIYELPITVKAKESINWVKDQEIPFGLIVYREEIICCGWLLGLNKYCEGPTLVWSKLTPGPFSYIGTIQSFTSIQPKDLFSCRTKSSLSICLTSWVSDSTTIILYATTIYYMEV